MSPIGSRGIDAFRAEIIAEVDRRFEEMNHNLTGKEDMMQELGTACGALAAQCESAMNQLADNLQRIADLEARYSGLEAQMQDPATFGLAQLDADRWAAVEIIQHEMTQMKGGFVTLKNKQDTVKPALAEVDSQLRAAMDSVRLEVAQLKIDFSELGNKLPADLDSNTRDLQLKWTQDLIRHEEMHSSAVEDVLLAVKQSREDSQKAASEHQIKVNDQVGGFLEMVQSLEARFQKLYSENFLRCQVHASELEKLQAAMQKIALDKGDAEDRSRCSSSTGVPTQPEQLDVREDIKRCLDRCETLSAEFFRVIANQETFAETLALHQETMRAYRSEIRSEVASALCEPSASAQSCVLEWQSLRD